MIQTPWIEGRLSSMERLSLQSFLDHGHAVDLYHYGPVEGVPAGVRLIDATAVLPASKIFSYTEIGGLSGFANFFRYKLLLDRGGWWVDLDVIALKRFPFSNEFSCASERFEDGSVGPCVCVLYAPPNHPAIRFLFEEADSKDPATLFWCETGTHLLRKAVQVFGLQSQCYPPDAFCPLECYRWQDAIRSDTCVLGLSQSYPVHLWNEMWRLAGLDKDLFSSNESLWASLKRTHLVDNLTLSARI